jgi:hypothetical protein
MPAKDLIDLDRAKLEIQQITDSTQDNLLGVLITAVSDAIVKYCRREFIPRAYDELYNGNGERRLLLREYPILSVESVRYRPVTVLKITNTLAANVQARVSVTNMGLLLVRTNAGVKYNDTSCTYASNATLTALAAAINALGSGWSAQIVGDSINYGNWPSSDLYWSPSFGTGVQSQGALSCVAGSYAELKMHTYELQGFQWDARGWLLRAIPYTDPELLHPEDLVFPVGINNFRIQYTAGYNPIPEAVQEAAAQWVSALYYATQRDPALARQAVPGSISQDWGKLSPIPDSVVGLLASYRRHTIANNQS